VEFSSVTFLDIEASRAGEVLAIGAVRGDQALAVGADAAGIRALARLCGDGLVAGHNLSGHDLPLLSALPHAFAVPGERVFDTWVLSLLADPTRLSHALEKTDAATRGGALPDPVADARGSRDLAEQCVAALADLAAGEAAFYAALLVASGRPALCAALGVPPAAAVAPAQAAAALGEELLGRLCRVHLLHLLEGDAFGEPDEYLALALVVRFVAATSNDGRLSGPPSAALTHVPRFTELLARALGPICPDLGCEHRNACEVHRPFAEEILQTHFELESFRPQQKEIVMAMLHDRSPLVVLPTGGGKSLCYQLPAIHGAERLRGLTVVISPLQALMADQVRGLSRRFPPTCLLNRSTSLCRGTSACRPARTRA
jgi:ATP-dependent DNA helicase RecQ